MKLNFFSIEFRKKKKLVYQVSSKSVQWEPSCSMRTDRQTDGHDKANRRFFPILWTRLKMRRVQRRVITFSKTITSLCHTALNSITEYRNLDSLLVLSVRKRASVCVFAKHTHTHTARPRTYIRTKQRRYFSNRMRQPRRTTPPSNPEGLKSKSPPIWIHSHISTHTHTHTSNKVTQSKYWITATECLDKEPLEEAPWITDGIDC